MKLDYYDKNKQYKKKDVVFYMNTIWIYEPKDESNVSLDEDIFNSKDWRCLDGLIEFTRNRIL